MRKIFTTLCIALFCATAFANYSTPGSGKRWSLDSLVTYSAGDVTFSNNTYLFNDTITISQSDTLFILKNATIKFAAGVFVDINGVMRVLPPDSVKITAQDTAAKFLGLKFEDFSDGSVLKKTIFEYGCAIRMLTCDILIDSCIIRNNTLNSSFSSSGVITFFQSNSTVSRCKIYGNRSAALQSGANIASSGQILFNEIYDNVTANGNTPQINWGATNTTPPMIIKGNSIRGGLYTNSGGISFLPIGSANVIIEDNIIKKNRYGIAFAASTITAYVNNNIIDSNNIQGSPSLGGSGINFNSPTAMNVICARNKIRGNLWGITIQGGAKPNIGNIVNSDTTDIGLNQIYWNGNSGKIYDLYNNTPDSIKAQNNFWGTTILDSVEAHIFHRPDSTTLGFVDYLPIRVVTETVSQNSSILFNGFKLYDAFPNPFNPVTNISYEISRKMQVTLGVYDMNGKLVSSIFSGIKEPGKYEEHFNAAALSSGIYFYRIESEGFSDTKKLILLK
ncbi:MAG: T9SS type A sorting domain-containing protein [Bacteroidetes bacterium]|nr:T9SS type A sorting domain-containing protein [Bacteroidota bacterium]